MSLPTRIGSTDRFLTHCLATEETVHESADYCNSRRPTTGSSYEARKQPRASQLIQALRRGAAGL